MLKVGDRLSCKRDYINYNSIKGYFYKCKGEYHTITDIVDNKIYFNDYYLDLKFDFWNYYYTPQEMRKLKLKQLNDVKSR